MIYIVCVRDSVYPKCPQSSQKDWKVMPAAPESVPARFPARGSQTGPAATAGERRSSPRHRGHPGRWYFRGSPLKLGSKLFVPFEISVIRSVDPSDPHLHAPSTFRFQLRWDCLGLETFFPKEIATQHRPQLLPRQFAPGRHCVWCRHEIKTRNLNKIST